ncbi:MAG TPA: ATP-binding protein [Kofleriaceae bacterium]|nr:ATP-binding protein [Kofleriaceae bacterium]
MGAAPTSDVAVLRRLADRVPSMLAYWDADLRCRFANRAYEKWFGRTPESIKGRHISELLGPQLYALNLPHITAALRGQAQEFEREIPDPAGGPSRHSLASYLPDIAHGVVRGFFVLVTDISEIKRAKLALEASEAKFSGIISISSDAIISVDGDQKITLFNRGAEAMFGYAPDEILGQPLDRLLPERYRADHQAHLVRFACEPEDARAIGERIASIVGLRKTGQEFPAEASISKLEIEGRPLLTVALRDVTDRKRFEAEQALLAKSGAVLASSLEWDRTVHAIGQLVVEELAELCIIDTIAPSGRVMRISVTCRDPAKAELCERLGALALESRHLLASRVLETGEPHVFDDIDDALISANAREGEHLEILRAIGPRSALAVPLIVGQRVLGALVLVATTPHQFGARDVRIATELGRRAALAIENAHLYESARRATAARDEVLGIVAHDVRAPLNAMALATKTLERQAAVMEHPRARHAVEMLATSLQRANRLICDLLDVSRIEGGALSIQRQAIEVSPVIREALSGQELVAAEAGVELAQAVVGDVPAVCGDRHRVLQVLDNLVGNALKFTPVGGRVTITARVRGDDVVFSVSDTGVGIPAESVRHIFDRFWQAERARRDGAGLGLTISKGIVEAHGGTIWVESTPGQGSTFSFTLPAIQAVALQDACAAAQAS